MSDLVRPGQQLDARIVEKWFTLIADRIGRPLERVTVKYYLSMFDRAGVTDRGLDAALEDIFGRIVFWSELTPESVITLAREKEVDCRVAERRLLPTFDADRASKLALEEQMADERQRAQAWADANPEPARLILERRQAEFCQMGRVETVDDLTEQQRIALEWVVIRDYINGGIRVKEPLKSEVNRATR